MEPLNKRLLGQIKPNSKDEYNMFSSNKLVIFTPKVLIGRETTFDCYQFAASLTQALPVIVCGKNEIIKPGCIIPINAGDPVLGAADMVVDQYLVVFIEKDFLRGIARIIYGSTDIKFENACFKFDPNDYLLLKLFMEESEANHPGREYVLLSLSTNIVVNFLRKFGNNLPSKNVLCDFNEKRNVSAVIGFLRENYNKEYSTQEVARIANLSTYHFIRVFKAETGKTPYEYLLDIKIEKSKEFLMFKNRSITEICYLCGFNNLSHFTTLFKRKTGLSPSEYRKSIY